MQRGRCAYRNEVRCAKNHSRCNGNGLVQCHAEPVDSASAEGWEVERTDCGAFNLVCEETTLEIDAENAAADSGGNLQLLPPSDVIAGCAVKEPTCQDRTVVAHCHNDVIRFCMAGEMVEINCNVFNGGTCVERENGLGGGPYCAFLKGAPNDL
ncbi:MAG: hypothetical protein JXR76_05645 [Deltaproteobacteria bacterium]|nr:hypothetical protein [Deltaproteobacteria bacterium]